MANQNGSQQQNTNPGTLVSVKRVRKGEDTKGREKIVLTFGTDNQGANGLEALISALETYRGKQVNFDIRLDQKTTDRGVKFDTAFVIIKEMIPKDQQGTTYTPKNQSRADAVRAKAEKIQKQFE